MPFLKNLKFIDQGEERNYLNFLKDQRIKMEWTLAARLEDLVQGTFNLTRRGRNENRIFRAEFHLRKTDI